MSGGQHPHRRRNALTGEWVLVSPQRTDRPWQGGVSALPGPSSLSYDPTCYLCPGNQRANGQRNPVYTGPFAFDNDFPALLTEPALEAIPSGGLLTAESERGICRVLCFSPRHDLTLGRMTRPEIRAVIDVWGEESARLASLEYIRHVQIFENRGEMMGASNPHPHCQIWASQRLPTEHVKELHHQREYMEQQGRCLLCDYLGLEAARGERGVVENEGFTALVPFWAVWPFETLIAGKRHVGSLENLTPAERDQLADILKRLTTRYDNLFQAPFPYTMGFHQSPCDSQAGILDTHREWHLHAHFYPPLLRSATVRKFMVGYEMLAMPQRDITPEAAAQRLRACSEIHYLDQAS